MPIPATILALAFLTPASGGGDAPSSAELASKAEAFTSGAEEPSRANLTAEALRVLLATSERYEPDPPVGRLRPDRLEAWQEQERTRLDALRARAAASGEEWPYEGVYRVAPGGRIPAGYRVGGTAIAAEALLLAPGADDARREQVARSVRFVLRMLREDPSLAPFQDRTGAEDPALDHRAYDVRGWGHTYALSLILRLLEEGGVEAALGEEARAAVPGLLRALAAGEGLGGGWNYASGTTASPFQTGATLLVLFRAQAQGFTVEEGLVRRALDALERGRREDSGSYSYSVRPSQRGHREAMNGSSARASVAELALFLGGRSSAERLRVAVDGFFLGWDDLLVRKSQQGTHEGPYGIAPYYFFFGHGYAALAIEALPEGERAPLRDQLLERLVRTREEGGGWNDRVFPRTRSYGTAMALQALVAPGSAPHPGWSISEGEPAKNAAPEGGQ